MYIENIDIISFKCFSKTSANFNHPASQNSILYPNVNLIIGANGSGKTSLFRAICLSLITPMFTGIGIGISIDFMARRPIIENKKQYNTGSHNEYSIIFNSRLDIRFLSRSGSSYIKEEIGFEIVTRDDIDLLSRANRSFDNTDDLYQQNTQGAFLLAYGANRRMGRPEGYDGLNRHPFQQRIISIFEEHISLIPFTLGFLELNESQQLDQAIEILNSLLPTDVQLTKERDSQKRPLFKVKNTSMLPVNSLSDGYRIFISWVWDMLYQMDAITQNSQNKNFKEIEGVVIVDEVDLFLHPEWQRTVIKSIATTFPKIQFFFSTHSPLVTGTVEPENIYVMEEEADGATVIKQYKENVYGLTANQILTSSYFGLSSTRAPGTGTLVDMARREKSGINVLDEIAAESEE